ncbi:hypothetical protein JXA32_17175 [Candidatus Sumerlaeota bacterium]|nr:hypothetical protein [Candidatus Sumerlaeota bacterium]
MFISSCAINAQQSDVTGSTEGQQLFKLQILCSGSRESELEPCSCSSNQLGGIDREAWLLDDYVEREGEYLLLDAGSLLKARSYEMAKVKSEYMLKALLQMNFHAINLNRDDVRVARELLAQGAKEHPEAPFISSNLFDPDSNEPLYQQSKIIEWPLSPGSDQKMRIGIIGLTQTADEKTGLTRQIESIHEKARPEYFEPNATDPVNIAREQVKKLAPETDLIIALASMPDTMAVMIAEQVEGLDLVINCSPPNSGLLGPARPKKTDGARVVQIGYLGRYICKLWLEGNLKDGATKMRAFRVEIPPDGERKPEITKIVDEYYKAAKDEMPVKNEPIKISYIGAEACKMCHEEIFKSWKQTPHAHALNTLKEVEKHDVPECLSCHVVGYMKDNGFRDYRSHEYLGGVQCENCHGPGNDHYRYQLRLLTLKNNPNARAPQKPKDYSDVSEDVPESVCVACHHDPADPHFNYAEYVKLVDHEDDVPDKVFDPNRKPNEHAVEAMEIESATEDAPSTAPIAPAQAH